MIFLPQSLVKVVLKLAKQFNLLNHDEFSFLDTLQFALEKKFENCKNGGELSDDDMCIFIISVIRLTEKFNTARQAIGKDEILTFFNELGIKNVEHTKQEFEAFKLMNFEVKEPKIFEAIYNMIEHHLNKTCDIKEKVFSIAIDILRLVYCWKSEIYDELSKMNENAIAENDFLWAASIVCVALKVLNTSDFGSMFESIYETYEISPQKLNLLVAIIYKLLIKKDSNESKEKSAAAAAINH